MEEMSSDRFVVQIKSADSDQRAAAMKECFRMWKCVLESGGQFIKTNDFRRLQQTICRLLLQLQGGSKATQHASLSDSSCRYELYSVLTALVSCPHPHRPSSLQCAIRIFETGQRRDTDPNVAIACRNGLLICALVAKPRLPYMESVLPEEDAEETVQRADEIIFRPVDENVGQPAAVILKTTQEIVDTPARPTSSHEETTESSPVPAVRDSIVSAETFSSSADMHSTGTSTIDKRSENCQTKRVSEMYEVVTIDDTSNEETDVIPIDKNFDFSRKEQDAPNEQMDSEHTESDKELNSMLGDFVEEPAESIDVYID